MTVRTKAELQALFETGDFPDGAAFTDLIDSYLDANFANWPGILPAASAKLLSEIAAASVITEWVDVAQAVGFVDTDTVVLSTDLTSTFLVGRRVRANLATGYVYTEVLSSSYDGGTNATTVNLKDAVVDATISDIDIGIFTPQASGGAIGLGLIGVSAFMQTMLDDATQTAGRQTLAAAGRNDIVHIADGRVSVSSADAAPENSSNGTYVYYVPYVGNRIALWSAATGIWETLSFTVVPKAHAAIANSKVFDVFAFNNAGDVDLELVQWTNDTTRATALYAQDGVVTKDGDPTRRYLATCYKNATGVVVDQSDFRHVWNVSNQVARPLLKLETTDSWTSTNASWHYANSNSANIVSFVLGNTDALALLLIAMGRFGNDTATWRGAYPAGIGFDSGTLSQPALAFGGNADSNIKQLGLAIVTYFGGVGVGKHFFSWLEKANGTDIQTFFGDGATTLGEIQCGLAGIIIN